MQQQEGALDCGLFSIATAYHMARGDGQQRFDQSLMRQHLMACFEKQALSPFPQVAGKKLSISVMKHLFIPESYGSRMVQCDSCDVWFHFKCISITEEPEHFVCTLCMMKV